MNTPIRELPDGSGCFTATIMSDEEAKALPLKDRPLSHRISSEIYHAVFEAVGAASMCWNPKPGHQVFDSSAAEKIAVELCFKIANEIEGRVANKAETRPDRNSTEAMVLPLDEHTKRILGFMAMDCRPYAEMLRADGVDIPRKIEAEQATVLHWMLGYHLKHGANWREEAGKYVTAHITRKTSGA